MQMAERGNDRSLKKYFLKHIQLPRKGAAILSAAYNRDANFLQMRWFQFESSFQLPTKNRFLIHD